MDNLKAVECFAVLLLHQAPHGVEHFVLHGVFLALAVSLLFLFELLTSKSETSVQYLSSRTQ
jgi:hypothetical protein